jgi:hypothetical protein
MMEEREARMQGRWRGLKMGIVATVPLVLLSGTLAHAEIKINPQGWKFPNLVTAAKEIIRVSDRTPLIPGKETILKGYRKADGSHFLTFEIEGRVFGVQVDTDGKPPFEYGIMDTDGDGKFETKIIPDKEGKDRGYVPQWVVDYYYSKHPELKKPSAKVKPPPPALASAPAPEATPAPKKAAAAPPPEILLQPNP